MKGMTAGQRLWSVTVVLVLLFHAVTAFYFPIPVTNITLPDLGGVEKPLPPLLKLYAIRSRGAEVEYGVEDVTPSTLFFIRRDELMLREEGIVSPKRGTQKLFVKVKGITPGMEEDSAAVNVIFTDRKLECDRLERDMCFWAGGRFNIRRSQQPTRLGYLSSDFLLELCRNHTVSYRVVGGDDYVRADRVTNTKSNPWILSLSRKIEPKRIEPIRGRLRCSVTSGRGLATVYEQPLEVTIDEEEDRHQKKSVPEDLEIMSLIAPEGKESRAIPFGYPKSAQVSRFVAFAARVVEPVTEDAHESIRGRNKLREIISSGVRFRMEPEDALRITESGGIVYVHDPVRLRNMTSFSIRVTWAHPKGFTASSIILINVSNPEGSLCGRRTNDMKSRKSCSQRTSQEECLKTCGISTGLVNRTAEGHATSSGCQWRSNERPDVLSVSYQTCSPDLRTCPDRLCDPLEQLFPGICPQDCADYVFGSANKDSAVPGISSAAGVCSCSPESGQQSCTCNLLDPKKRQGKIRKVLTDDKTTISPLSRYNDLNVSVIQAVNSEECGMVCLTSILGGSVILMMGVTIFSLILYHRRLKKRCPNQGPVKEDMININYEEYIDRSADGIRVNPRNAILDDKPEYYDKKWEFPRYRLTVEETLGEGEFGKVLKAKAEGIGGIDGPTTVAVKTLKENAKDSELADLISEYQLLKEVDHPNIIHLLGACTTLDGPLYVIIEYARHGSLRNYLRRNRHLGSELHLSDKEYETSYVQTITPKDILTFAWQIAKGMAYLTEMKLVHRDLAARNVLVAEGLICKISDFGLTRDIYEDDTYLKRSKGRVPVKWMALESLSDHVYTTKSDVWSYGIVLWELVTTGGSPYPGIAVQNLFHLLKSGYRMEKPVNCSPELYQIVRSCWHENPSHRPTFKSLVLKLEEMLGEGKDYLDLNPRIIENKTYFSDFAADGEKFPSETVDGRIFKWNFDFSENATSACKCITGECTCRPKVKYENEMVGRKPKYENASVEDASYVQPKGEPKPINSFPSEVDSKLQESLDGLPCPNLYIGGNGKVCEGKII